MQHQMTIGISAATVNQLYRCAPLHRIPPAPCPYLTPWRCALFSCRRPCLPALPAAPSKALPATPSKAPPALPTCLSACVHRMTRVLAQRAKATCWQSLARRSGRPAVQSRRPAAPVGHDARNCKGVGEVSASQQQHHRPAATEAAEEFSVQELEVPSVVAVEVRAPRPQRHHTALAVQVPAPTGHHRRKPSARAAAAAVTASTVSSRAKRKRG